jgi:hypothetical protein
MVGQMRALTFVDKVQLRVPRLLAPPRARAAASALCGSLRCECVRSRITADGVRLRGCRWSQVARG